MAGDTGLKHVVVTGRVGLGGGMGGGSRSAGGGTRIGDRKGGRGIGEIKRKKYAARKYQIGTALSVPVASVLGL